MSFQGRDLKELESRDGTSRILIGRVPEGGGKTTGSMVAFVHGGFSESYCGARAWRGEKHEFVSDAEFDWKCLRVGVQPSDVLPVIHRKEKITNLLKQSCCLLDEYEWNQERKGEEERQLGRTVWETVSKAAKMQNQDADAA